MVTTIPSDLSGFFLHLNCNDFNHYYATVMEGGKKEERSFNVATIFWGPFLHMVYNCMP